ncbi:MAG: iron-sulfur cluster assembly protein [Chloroflexi bacterium]|nr:iron-sulfur cluster assembly protein [Chloroflexota bacterium]MDA8187572.1 iron-sulfur cluster assembly protein [Dehalococcoidales bacterium]
MATVTEQQVIEKLREVMDPHTGSNVWDMGMVKDLVLEENRLSLRFTLTSNFCPIGMQLGLALKRKLRELPIEKIDIKIENYLRAEELEKVLEDI